MSINSISSNVDAYFPISKSRQSQTTGKDSVAKTGQAPENTSPNTAITNWQPTEVTIQKTSAQWVEDFQSEIQKFVTEPLEKMNRALSKIVSKMDYVNGEVSSVNKKIKSTDWDFALKDGALEVTGASLTGKDKKSIEKILNSDDSLVKSVKDFNDSVVTYYQNAPGHTSSFSTGILTSENATYFNNVKDDINGTLSIKSLMVKSKAEETEHFDTASEIHKFDYVMKHIKGNLTSSHRAVYEYSDVAEVIYKKG